jgi:hypothetical protein
MAIEQIIEGESVGSMVGKINNHLASAQPSTNTRFAPQLPSGAESVTLTAELNSSTYAKTWDKLGGDFIYLAGGAVQASEQFPQNELVTAVQPDTYVASFLFHGDSFEIKYNEVVGSIDIVVDGVSADKLIVSTTTGDFHYLRVDFADTRLRRIDLVVANMRTGDIYTDVTDTVQPSLNPKKVVIAGDSFTEGSGTSAIGFGYVPRLRLISGNLNIVQAGS